MPAWSPDGSRLAFDFRSDDLREIWVLDIRKLSGVEVGLEEIGSLPTRSLEESPEIRTARRILESTERALGPDDPETATCLNILADLYRAMGAYAKAEQFYQRALEIREKA